MVSSYAVRSRPTKPIGGRWIPLMSLSRRSANELLQREKNLVRSQVFFPPPFLSHTIKTDRREHLISTVRIRLSKPSSSLTDCSKSYNLSRPRRTSYNLDISVSHHSSLMNLLRILEKMNFKLGGQLSHWTTKLKKRGKGGKVTNKKRYCLQKHNHVLHLEHMCPFNRSWGISLKDVIKAKWGQSLSDRQTVIYRGYSSRCSGPGLIPQLPFAAYHFPSLSLSDSQLKV